MMAASAAQASRQEGEGRKTAIILNRSAGTLAGQPIDDTVAAIRSAFERHGAEVSLTAVEPADCASEIRKAIDSDAELVIVGGGDGTIHTAVNMILPTGKILGILPLGTMNLLARDLKTPLDLDEAYEALAAGEVSSIDVAEVNGEVYLNSSVLGFYPQVVQEREEKRKRHRLLKWPAMALAMVRTIRRLPLLDVRIDWGDGPRRVRTPILVVSNNPFDGEAGSMLLRRDRLDSGKLGVYVARQRDPWGLLRLMGRTVLGTWQQDEELETLTATQLTVHSRRRRLKMVNDGEILQMEPPLNYRIRHKALKVLLPKAAPEGDGAADGA